METFKLLFEGQRCGNYADLPLKEHLRLLKFPEAACEKISNNPRVALKAKLKYLDAIEQQKKFIKLGLETSLKLELNPKLFKLGLISKEQTPELLLQPESEATQATSSEKPSPESANNATIHLVDKKFTDPMLFSRPGRYAISNENKDTLLNLSSATYSFNGLLLIAASAYAALTFQSYLIVILLGLNVPNLIASALGITFLITFTVCMPRILQPLQACELIVANKTIELIDDATFIINKKRVTWTCHESNTQGHLLLELKKAFAYAPDETYQWNAEHQVTKDSLKSINAIQDAIIDGTIADTVITILKQIKNVFNFFSPNITKTNWDDQTSSVITNQKNEIIALIYAEPSKAYRIINTELSEDPLLHAFCLYIQRNRLV